MVFEIIQIGIWFFDGQLETVSLFFAAIARSPYAALFNFLSKRSNALRQREVVRLECTVYVTIKLSILVF